jgi:hypothetical protein
MTGRQTASSAAATPRVFRDRDRARFLRVVNLDAKVFMTGSPSCLMR